MWQFLMTDICEKIVRHVKKSFYLHLWVCDKDRGKKISLHCECVSEDTRRTVFTDEGQSHYLDLCIPDHGQNVLKRLGNRNLLN
jgi:hypothetical protein